MSFAFQQELLLLPRTWTGSGPDADGMIARCPSPGRLSPSGWFSGGTRQTSKVLQWRPMVVASPGGA